MKLLTPTHQAQPRVAHRLPTNPELLRRLARRGVQLEQGPEEQSRNYEARIETALMALFRDFRDDATFEALYAYAAPCVLRLISCGLGGQARRLDPQELCQDVFVNIYRYAGGFRDDHPRSFRGWVGAIARNIIRRKLATVHSTSIHDLPDGISEPADKRFGPAACASIKEERESIGRSWGIILQYYLAAFAELSARDREALHMIEVEGLSYIEACGRLKVEMSNMKMIMFRARKRIRTRIAHAMEIDGNLLEVSGRQVG
ncbi:MAG: RNA polymerase sigma factor (sigma-70 family) [Planctomycetota bacterium]